MDNLQTDHDFVSLKRAMESCLQYISAIHIVDLPKKPNAKVHDSATCFFVDTGKNKFAITNQHNLDYYRNKKESDDKIHFQLGSYLCDFETGQLEIIREGDAKYRDLLTFKVPDYLMNLLGKTYFRCSEWPPSRPKIGELMILAGFPKKINRQPRSGFGEAKMVTLLEIITSSSSNQFTSIFDRDVWIQLSGERMLESFSSMVGFSGSPVFRINDQYRLEPIGIIFEGNEESTIFDAQLGCHLDFVYDTGEIDLFY